MPLLEVQNLIYHYRTRRGPVRAVDDVSFSLRASETIALVGESGCGKTSTATAIIRLLPRNVEKFEGKVILDGQDIMALSNEEFRSQVRWKGISMVFQGAMNALSPTIRVGYQISEPLVVHYDMDKDEAFQQAVEALNQVRLPDYVARRYPHELSGGMKQRVVIAMALILKPRLVILDEPTSALDVMTQANIINLLKELKRQHGLSYLFITHDLGLASELADSVATMYAGRIVELGPADELYTTPRHPYTQKLLASVPRLRQEEEPDFIPGAPPDLTQLPAGCRFHPRCPFAFELCGWTSGEVAERLKLGLAAGNGGVPPIGAVEAPEPTRLRILPPGVGVGWSLRAWREDPSVLNRLADDLRAFFQRNPEADPAFKAVTRVSAGMGAVDVWLMPAKEPPLLGGGQEARASCWLLLKGASHEQS